MKTGALRVKFVALWGVLTLAKVLLAIWLPPFGDEAFYWQEGQHLAWAYSDLPGATAWLIRFGVAVGGDHTLAMRAPFLMIGAALPWLIRRIATRWYGADAGWQAGVLAMLLPLSGLMGLLALPDVPMIFAALLCLDACAV
jgi:4-amino-4-deoxy-L-arabinose transferase-like glycosyltransferase